VAEPEDAATDPRFFRWTDGTAVVDGDWGEHLREHEDGVREWLAGR